MRAAVIGCGVQGRLHLAALQRLESVTIEAVCDADDATLADARERFGVGNGFTNYETLFDRHELDLVCVCTMPNTHRAIALRALTSGAHVLCEKPFARNLAEAREIATTAEREDRVLTIGFNMRFMAAAELAAGAVRRGDIGEPLVAVGSLECGMPAYGSHFVRDVSGGGILALSGVHMIDAVRWVCGQPTPISANAFTARWYPRSQLAKLSQPPDVSTWDGENFVNGTVAFANGMQLALRADARLDRVGVHYRFEVRGADGSLQFDPFAQELGALQPVSSSELDGVMQASVDRELADVVAALQTGSRIRVQADEALVVQSIVDALYESAGNQREVAIEPA
jgi:predicted dehydrogenase